jgi:hypothetical protein
MDLKTLTLLLKEAEKNYKDASDAFEETDFSEDMHDRDHWKSTVSWLQNKINSLKNK